MITLHGIEQIILTSHHLTPVADPTPAAVAARLRAYQAMLHRWEPIIDHIPHLTQLVTHAHTACPWRNPTPNPTQTHKPKPSDYVRITEGNPT